MSSRSVASICLFAILLSALAQGQSTPMAVVNEPDGPTIAKRLRQETIRNLGQKPPSVPAAHHVATTPRHMASPTAASQFASAVTYNSGGSNAVAIVVADVNADGKPDLVVANNCANSSNCSHGTVAVLLGNGDGTFQTAAAYDSGGYRASSVAVADVNGDGKPDLIVANICTSSNCNSGSTLEVLLGNGDGTFQTPVTYSSAISLVVVADINRDGKADIVGDGSVLLGNGDGTFQAPATYSTGPGVTGTTSIAIGDVNGDDNPDLLISSYCGESPACNPAGASGAVSLLLGKGDGTFQAPLVYSSGDTGATSVVIGDLNGDGKPDLVVSNACKADTYCEFGGFVYVLLGNGNGTFKNAVGYDPGGYDSVSLALADINGDGKLDVLVVNYCGSLGPCDDLGISTVGVLLGNGGGTFQTAVTYDTGGYSASSIAVADVDGDGSPDLIVANNCDSSSCNNGTVSVLLNTASGIASSTTLSPISPSSVAFGTGITLTAKVDSLSGPPPDGQIVTFKNAAANVTLGTGPLSKGTAIFTSTAIPAGSYSVIASYPGGSDFWSSISSPSQVLNVQDFKLAASPATVTVSPGQSGSTTITATTFGNLNAQTLTNWNCSGLPSASSCSFGSFNSKNQISLKINTTAAAQLHWPLLRYRGSLFYALLLPGLLGMVSAAGRRRRFHGTQVLAWLVLLCLSVFWVACGGSSSSGNLGHGGTPTGSSSVTVSASSGSLQRSTTITLNVQ